MNRPVNKWTQAELVALNQDLEPVANLAREIQRLLVEAETGSCIMPRNQSNEL